MNCPIFNNDIKILEENYQKSRWSKHRTRGEFDQRSALHTSSDPAFWRAFLSGRT